MGLQGQPPACLCCLLSSPYFASSPTKARRRHLTGGKTPKNDASQRNHVSPSEPPFAGAPVQQVVSNFCQQLRDSRQVGRCNARTERCCKGGRIHRRDRAPSNQMPTMPYMCARSSWSRAGAFHRAPESRTSSCCRPNTWTHLTPRGR